MDRAAIKLDDFHYCPNGVLIDFHSNVPDQKNSQQVAGSSASFDSAKQRDDHTAFLQFLR